MFFRYKNTLSVIFAYCCSNESHLFISGAVLWLSGRNWKYFNWKTFRMCCSFFPQRSPRLWAANADAALLKKWDFSSCLATMLMIGKIYKGLGPKITTWTFDLSYVSDFSFKIKKIFYCTFFLQPTSAVLSSSADLSRPVFFVAVPSDRFAML